MTLGFFLVIIFLAGYFLLSSAIIMHVNRYSFSRPARWMTKLFIIFALILGIFTLMFFSRVEWNEIFNLYAKFGT
jgi:hypothetical protein